jgi:hypothetical protein
LSDHHYIFDERFAESFLHSAKPHSVFGVSLKPFSNWHRLQLEWIDSKVLLGGAQKWDLYLAARICSTEYPHVAPNPGRGNLHNSLWHLRHWHRNPSKELKAFYAYLEDFSAPPKLWGGKGSSMKKLSEAYEELHRITGNPSHLQGAREAAYQAFLQENQDTQLDDTLSQVAYYCKATGRPPVEAWNMPIGELAWMNIAFAKLDGGKIDIWTPMDEEHFQAHLLTRQQKIAEIAKEIERDRPEVPSRLSMPLAAVKYWQQVVDRTSKG